MTQNASDTIVALTTTAPGTALDVRLFGIPRTINYKGDSGDRYQVQVSTDGGTNYACPDGFDRTANDAGTFSIQSELRFTHVRLVKKAGTGGGACQIDAPPLAVSLSAVALNIRTDTTPGTYADLRTVGPGRTIAIAGAAGSKYFIEGSEDGATDPFSIGTWTIPSGRTGLVLSVANLANYARVTRLKGDTASGGGVCGDNPGDSAVTAVLNLAELNVGNRTTAGPIGGLTPDVTVDIYGVFNVQQTSTGTPAPLALTLASPTDTTAGQVRYVLNTGTAAFMMFGVLMNTGIGCAFLWEGTAWKPCRPLSAWMSALKGSAQTIVDNAAAAIVTGWGDPSETGDDFNKTTGVYTVPVLGYYNIGWSFEWAATAAAIGASFEAGIAVDGVLVANTKFTNPVDTLAQVRNCSGQTGIYLTMGQSVTMVARVVGAGGNIANTTNASGNRLSIALMP